MMLQKKSNPWMRGKALYILPVAVIALSAFATPEVNQQVETEVSHATKNQGKVTKVSEMPQVLNAESEEKSVVMSSESEQIAENDTVAENDNKKAPDDYAYEAADKMPEYPGGIHELIYYVGSELRYPEEAQKLGVTGRVILGFVVEKDGSVSEVKVESCTNNVPVSKDDERSSEVLEKQKEETKKLFQDEAVRVVKSMPNWTPGEKDGKKVRVRYHLPITFNLR